MAMLELDADATEALIADHPQVTVGIYASPRQTVISGPTEQIDELIAQVRAQGQFAGKVNIEVAPHNPAMDALQPAMRSELAGLTPRPPTIPIISTTYAKRGKPSGIRRRALGHQHAQPGALPAGHYRRRGRSPHLHRDQRAPVVDPCHQRNARRARTGGQRRCRLPEPRQPATRRARHPDLPHQPQGTPPARPQTTHVCATAPRAAHHALAAHPALDRPHRRRTPHGRHPPAARHRRHRPHHRYPDMGMRAPPGSAVARRPRDRRPLRAAGIGLRRGGAGRRNGRIRERRKAHRAG